MQGGGGVGNAKHMYVGVIYWVTTRFVVYNGVTSPPKIKLVTQHPMINPNNIIYIMIAVKFYVDLKSDVDNTTAGC